MLRALCGQGFPNRSSSSKFMNMKQTKNLFKISKGMYENMNRVLAEWSGFWECLNSEKLLKYEKYFREILVEKQDIAGGQIEYIFLKNEIFYKKLSNEMVMNEVFMYSRFIQDYPLLVPFLPDFHGIASLEQTEKFIDSVKRESMKTLSEFNLQRMESLKFSKLKPKKRKKRKYIDKINLQNQQNKKLFEDSRLDPAPSSPLSSPRLAEDSASPSKMDEQVESSDNFIISKFDVVGEFKDFPSFEEVWQFNSLLRSGQIDPQSGEFPGLKPGISTRTVPSDKKQLIAAVKGDLNYYLALENLIIDDSYSILDLKLQLVRQDRKFIFTDAAFRFECPADDRTMKIVGLIIKSKDGKVLLNINKGCSYFDYSIQKRFFKRFFEFEKGSLDLEAMCRCVELLEKLKQILVKYGLVLVSSSVLFFYSAKKKHFFLKLVDFSNFPKKMKSETEIMGLTVFIECLKEIIQEAKPEIE